MDKRWQELIAQAEAAVQPVWQTIAAIEAANQKRVLEAFHGAGVTASHLGTSTGYGLGDKGREAVDRTFALALQAEAAYVRTQIVSGTHALAICLEGLLDGGGTIVAATGRPYDTLWPVLQHLRQRGVRYVELPPAPDLGGTPGVPAEGHANGTANWPDHTILAGAVRQASTEGPVTVLIQRSRGYARRPSLGPDAIGDLAEAAHKAYPQAVVLVDNCYGEFASDREPTAMGADIIAGSLIKNPGGGLVPSGGYIAGRKDVLEQVAWRLTAPGIGGEEGPSLLPNRLLLQGLFMAPHVVAEAMRGAVVVAYTMAALGYDVSPAWNEPRYDIVQAVRLGSPEALLAFCRGIQAAGPVDHAAVPEPAPMPGYADQIVMAAGTFVQGATSELSADAPLRPPFEAFVQGGLTYQHVRLGLLAVLKTLEESRLLRPGGA